MEPDRCTRSVVMVVVVIVITVITVGLSWCSKQKQTEDGEGFEHDGSRKESQALFDECVVELFDQ